MKKTSVVKSALCTLLAAAVVVSAPGLGAYQAAAQTVPQIHINVPVGGMPAGVSGVGAAASGLNTRVTPSLPGVGILPGVQIPSVQMQVPGLVPTAAPSANAGVSLALPVSVISNSGASVLPVQPGLRPGGGAPGVTEMPVMPGQAASAQGGAAIEAVPSIGAVVGRIAASDVAAVPAVSPDAASLQTVRGRENRLNLHFDALRRLFEERRDAADLRPEARSDGSAVSAAAEGGSAVVEAARGWLSRIPFLSRRVIAAPDAEAAGALALKLSAGKAAADVPAPVVLQGVEQTAQPLERPALAADGKTDLSLPASVIPGTKASSLSAAAPAAAVETPKPEEPKAGLSKTAWWFIGSLLVAQVAVEALGSSMPTLVQKAFGDFTVVAQLAVFSSMAGIIGRQLGPLVVEKFGLKKSYVGTILLRTASISALIALMATGHMTLPLMMAFYSLNALLMGINVTALNSIPPLLVGQNQSALDSFWGRQHTLVEIIGISGPIVTGIVVAQFGFLPALLAFPVMMIASGLIVWRTLKLPADADLQAAAAANPSAAKPVGVAGVFKAFFQKMGRGAKLVWNTPALRYSFLGYSAIMMFNPFLYQMIAPGYALRLVGAASPEAATAIGGWLTGFYSAGGLIGGLLMTMGSRRLAKQKEEGRIDDAKETAIMRTSMLRWMLLATAALTAFVPLMFNLPMLGSVVALPAWLAWAKGMTLPALALLPFGIAQVVSYLKLTSFFQSRVPRKEDMADAMGFFGSGSLIFSTLGMIALKYLFKLSPLGLTPFYYLALLMIPFAISYLLITKALAKHSKPQS